MWRKDPHVPCSPGSPLLLRLETSDSPRAAIREPLAIVYDTLAKGLNGPMIDSYALISQSTLSSKTPRGQAACQVDKK